MKISEKIKARIDENNARYYACDNIADFIYTDKELDQLQKEVENNFKKVLESMIIDVENDPNSKETAHRLSKMWLHELMKGRYHKQPKVTAFPNDGNHKYTGMLVVRAEINSVCAHHHQAVSGVAYIGIIPNNKVIGLSKYIRIAQWCARRGTLQEELTSQIANEIMKVTNSGDVAVYIEARHGCVSCRGVEQENSLTQTAVLYGQFKISDVKAEFYENIRLQKA